MHRLLAVLTVLILIPFGYSQIDPEILPLAAQIILPITPGTTTPTLVSASTRRVDQYFAGLEGQHFAELTTEDLDILFGYAGLQAALPESNLGNGVRKYLGEVYRSGIAATRANFEARFLLILQSETSTSTARAFAFETIAADAAARLEEGEGASLAPARIEFVRQIFAELYKPYTANEKSVDAAAHALAMSFALQPHNENLLLNIENTVMKGPIESVEMIALHLLQLAQSHTSLPVLLRPSSIVTATSIAEALKPQVTPLDEIPNSYSDVLFREELLHLLITRSIGNVSSVLDLLQHLILSVPREQVAKIPPQTFALLAQIARNNSAFRSACAAALRL